MVKLSLNGQVFVCKDATAAAKIVDAILTLSTPVDLTYVNDETVRLAHDGAWELYYAKQLNYSIVPMSDVVYESREELDSTIERIKAVADEKAENEVKEADHE